jgi:hypothetical protein
LNDSYVYNRDGSWHSGGRAYRHVLRPLCVVDWCVSRVVSHDVFLHADTLTYAAHGFYPNYEMSHAVQRVLCHLKAEESLRRLMLLLLIELS